LKSHGLNIPIFVVLFLFGVLPTLYTFVLSLYKWYLPDPKGAFFIGFENYSKLFTDSNLVNSLENSIVFAFTATLIEVLLGLGLSLYLHKKITFNSKSYRLIMSVTCLPLTLSPLVSGILLVPLKANLNGFFLEHRIAFNMYAGELALPLLILVDIWQWAPFTFLIFLAKLHSLPIELFEAAEIDGASPWLAFRKLVFPMLASTILVVSIVRGVDAFKVLDIVFTTQGGPVSETETINFYIFKNFLTFSEIGYGATLTSFLTLVIQFLIIIFLVYSILVKKESLF